MALRWLSKDGARRDFTYADLRDETSRFANVLKRLGVGKGDPVAVLAGRIPELYIAALGTLKNGSVFTPLFSAFGPEPIQSRINIARAKVLVTTEACIARRSKRFGRRCRASNTSSSSATLPSVQKLSGVAPSSHANGRRRLRFTIPRHGSGRCALLHFTSGTTGKPKGAVHVHQAVVAHHATARFALDFHPDDVFWCTADPGWVTGTSYGIIAPLTHGLTSIVDEADFDAERWYSILQASTSLCGTRRRPPSGC